MGTSFHHKVIDFTLKSALIGVFCLLASAGSNAGNTLPEQHESDLQTLGADEAYIVVKIDRQGVAGMNTSSLNLSANNQLKLKIQKAPEMQLLKVKAGVYKPQLASLDESRGIVITPGTVTYIGNWKVTSGQRFMINGKAYSTSQKGFEVKFDVDSLFSYADQNSWLKQYPLHISHINGKRVSNNWTLTES